ncbi:BCCT family transporter [Desulfitobacterium chlororespirans]|uniref:Betaine/carnitine transporter, BCCT family n=1 Tax=Desulfitobacterium chlororespirans DSM 11544 TaxID=1121395 RepID=A0A1M7TF16_9FIRM|nr:BCCT family transporter [Desulfitobacterium chlororespirans]SHN69243.1 betaine/carnitine transporter, BCCT family [Desulfitobacterium chlororespirans DSM 11544]
MANGKDEKPIYARVNRPVFFMSVVVCLLFYGPMMIFQEAAQGPVNKAMNFITYSTDWLWEFVIFGCLIFLAWLAFGPYGRVKLGGPDDKPEFSLFTWVAMMFCGGSGAGLVYWALIEPVFYLQGPPFWLEPFSAQAAQFSLAYGIFHWGFSAWATFAVPAVAFGYMYYVRKKPYLYPSYACRGVIGKAADGPIGKLIDAIIIVGMVGGMATSLGFVIPMLSKISADYFGIAETMGFKIIVCILFSCIYTWSCYRGLKGGIAKLADMNMYLTFVILGFVLIVGPTTFMFSLFTDNIGVLLQNFIRMSFYTDPITQSGFPQGWTVFYWAWWLAWAVYVGLFAARISKGRTIRALIGNMVFTATAGCMLFYLIFGSYQVDAIMNHGADLAKILAEEGGPAVISWFLNSLPFSSIVIPFFIFVMAISQATGVDAASFTMANMACYEVKDGVEPPKWIRLCWAGILFLATVALLLVGGMEVVQLSSVLTAVPVLFLLIILAISTVKWLREDFGYAKPLTTNKYDGEDLAASTVQVDGASQTTTM